MELVLWIDDVSRRAGVHKTTCHCFGNRKANRTKTGHWVRDFVSLVSAFSYARSMEKDPKACGHCKP